MTVRSRHLVLAVVAALLLGAVAGLLGRALEGAHSPTGERVRDAAATLRGAAQRATQGAGGADRGPPPARP